MKSGRPRSVVTIGAQIGDAACGHIGKKAPPASTDGQSESSVHASIAVLQKYGFGRRQFSPKDGEQ
jgi:hypothetical protein